MQRSLSGKWETHPSHRSGEPLPSAVLGIRRGSDWYEATIERRDHSRSFSLMAALQPLRESPRWPRLASMMNLARGFRGGCQPPLKLWRPAEALAKAGSPRATTAHRGRRRRGAKLNAEGNACVPLADTSGVTNCINACAPMQPDKATGALMVHAPCGTLGAACLLRDLEIAA